MGSASAYAATFPPDGLEVGQSYDVTTPFPLMPGSEAPSVPVHTKFDALLVDEDRPAGRLIQTVKIPEVEMPIGPFGASGTGKVSGDSNLIFVLALDTGWPVRVDGVGAYRVTLTSEKQRQSAETRVEMHIVLDDETLNEV